ncbi:DUF695 domain-containing protein [Pseudaeromonas paramecii]|uniref:DUF695 domain-containing protein n=1 Tax=Pseudaeromonas paramecii TaxID=2138166 RepID=A0ABP8Q005_9GAMM
MPKLLCLLIGLLIYSQVHAADGWGVATSEYNRKPLIYRFLLKPPSGIQISDYPDLTGISWVFEASVNNGMPDSATNTRMIEFEELLENKLEGSNNAFLTLCVTGNRRKEWQWYSRNVGETMKLINQALLGKSRFPILISRQSDPTWSAYFDVVKLVK